MKIFNRIIKAIARETAKEVVEQSNNKPLTAKFTFDSFRQKDSTYLQNPPSV
jgi:hypothetical protein